jgi:hypothetical protein
MAEQELMFPSSFQSSLKNLLVYVPRNSKKHVEDGSKDSGAQRGIKILDENIYFFIPTK